MAAKLFHLLAFYVSLFGVTFAQMGMETTMAIPRVTLTPIEAPANALPSSHSHTHTHMSPMSHTHISSAMTTPAPVIANPNINENVNVNANSGGSTNTTMPTSSTQGGNSSAAPPATTVPTVNAARRPSQPRLGKLTLVVGLVTYGLIML